MSFGLVVSEIGSNPLQFAQRREKMTDQCQPPVDKLIAYQRAEIPNEDLHIYVKHISGSELGNQNCGGRPKTTINPKLI
jgi:hypothetical protein